MSDRHAWRAALAAVALLLPAAAFPQSTGATGPSGSPPVADDDAATTPGGPPGGGWGPGGPNGSGGPNGPGGPGGPQWRDRMERRVRLARSLGLAEALDLDEAGIAKLNAAMFPFDARRKSLLDSMRADVRTLNLAARRGDPKAIAGVDAAIQRLFDARAQLLAVDREMLATISKDLPKEKVARMALFLARFRQRFGAELPEGPAPGPR